jgi:LuxR family maltose regulon positive regulatory protein
MSDPPVSIIRSKLYPPPIAPDAVRRERLLSVLQSAAQSPLTLVSAPAGYGKSTLVSQWLELCGCRFAWLSLDREDGHLRQFLLYVIAALRNVDPRCCADTARALQAAVLPEARTLAGVFCNDLDEVDEPIVLVLDDYHQVPSSEIDDFLDTVLKHPPRKLHLIITTRRNPSLSLPTLRARGALCEVRLQQLAFSEAETGAFMRAHLRDAVTNDELHRLHERTEGWPAALRLASLAAANPNSAARVLDQLPHDSYAVRKYLMQEVLANQPKAVLEYLLRAAFLDRFCPSLCDAVMPEGSTGISGREFVNHISQANMFSIGLDAREEWFRFHHLFQSMLQDQALTDLGGEAIRDVHRRAAQWFERREFLGEAIRHALSAERASDAADVIIRHRHEIMNHEWWHQLGIWLDLLPAPLVATRPELQLLKARLCRTRGQNTELVQTLDNAESLLETAVMEDGSRDELYGSLASMRCFQYYLETEGERSAQTARRALELLPPDNMAERGFAMILLGAALQMSGDASGARNIIYSAMADESAQGDTNATYRARLLVSLIFIHWMEADLKELKLVASNTARLCMQAELWEILTGSLQFIAAVDYHQNRLSAVEGDLRTVFQNKAIANPEFYAHSLIISALASQGLGNSDEPLKISESLHDLAFRTRNPYLIGLSEALVAELAMRQGRIAEALNWASQYDPEPFVPFYAFFAPPMCLAKVLILHGSADSLKRAQALLPRLQKHLTKTHNKRFLIETLALRALLSDRSGDTGLAIEQLGNALSLAQPGSFIRLFVDIGPEMIPLLNRLELQGEKLDYVGRILAAFQAQDGPTETAQTHARSGVTTRDVPGLPEQLSRREKEVLALLAARLTNKEIGERLYISTATVKRHAHSIYDKLDVKGRREAVTKAFGLGLISQ